MNPACIHVLNRLKAKKRGVCYDDFARGFRLAARIFDLREAGYTIQTVKDEIPGGTRARYVLVGSV